MSYPLAPCARIAVVRWSSQPMLARSVRCLAKAMLDSPFGQCARGVHLEESFFLSRIAVFDPISGASGDMILGALVDAGVPLTSIRDAVSRLGIQGVRITSQPASSGAVRGTRVAVESTNE